MTVKLREQLLVEKCLNSLIQDYRIETENENVNAEIDFKLDFLSFLSTNLPDEVKYGINYLKRFPNEYKLVMPMILEYNAFGLKGSLECKPIPNYSTCPSKEPETLVGKCVEFFKSLRRK